MVHIDNTIVRDSTSEAEEKSRYAEEKRKWTMTSTDPEAYAAGHWGIARRGGDKWSLFLILTVASMREMGSVESKEPPFVWARKQVDEWRERRKSATWEERMIGKRRPGEEGDKGGKLIPMQTFDEKGRKREVLEGSG